MKKIIVVLSLMVVLTLCLSFSSLAEPSKPATFIITNSSGTSTSYDRYPSRNTYPLQVNSPNYSYEPWAYSFSSVVSLGDYVIEVSELWTVDLVKNEGGFLAFNIGILVTPNVGTDYADGAVMSARLWNLCAVIGEDEVPLEIVDNYSVTFGAPNVATGSTNSPQTTQMQYICYSCVLEVPSAYLVFGVPFTFGIKANLNAYMWPSTPIQNFMFCCSDTPVQFENLETSTDIWANIFGNFLTPEKLEQNEENAEQAESAGEGVQDAMNSNVMSGQYGLGAQDGLNDIVVPLLDNPFISMVLPVGVVLMLLLWGIHKGNS